VSTLDDDGMPSGDFIAVEEPDPEGHKQALWIGVRPVFHGSTPSREPMIQICYQEEYEGSSLAGPVWITPETWEEISRAVRWRVKHHRAGKWRRRLSFRARVKFHHSGKTNR